MEFAKPWIGVIFTLSLHILPVVITTSLGVIFFFGPFWFVIITYYIWIYIDRDASKTGGCRRSETFRQLPFFKWLCKYFPMKLVKTTELDPSKNYVMGYHPHGLIGFGFQGNFALEGNEVSKVFPGLKIHAHAMVPFFKFPILRELSLASGAVDVSRESINFVLSEKSGGNVSALVPGGAREIFYSKPGTDVVFLKERKGFVKLAIQNGASLVPVYSFGETDLYRHPNTWILNIQKWLWNNLGIFPFVILGRGFFQTWFGILPQKVPVTSVVGAPIDVEKISNPTKEDVDVVHQKYMDALKQLYYKYRQTYGNPNSELIFV